MAVGQGALMSGFSYHAVGRETTYGTYNTCTAGLEVISGSMKLMKETKILEEVSGSRTYANFIQLGRVVEGDLEFYFSTQNLAATYLLHNAFGGGAVVSATATGETASGTAFTHTMSLNNFDTTYSSLCLNVRKGDSASAKVFQYNGVRVNEVVFAAELDEALKVSVNVIGKDATLTSNDVSSAIASSLLNGTRLAFSGGRFSVESSFASLTSTSFWHVQNMEFSIANNLKADEDSRRLGTDTIDVLPPGIAVINLKCSIRFDTSTAYDAMVNGTQLSAEFEFLGNTMTSSAIKEGIKIQFPKLIVMDAGDPEIGGPDEVLKSEVTFAVLRDSTSATGYAVRALVTNKTSSY